jgi:hypothetical protein
LSNSLFTVVKREARIFIRQGPIYHYVYSQRRLRRWLGWRRIKAINRDEPAFLAQFNLGRPSWRNIEQKAEVRKSYEDVKVNVVAHFQARACPCFFFEPKDVDQIISLIEDSQKETTICAADEICQNVFHFRQVRVKFENGLDWTYRPQRNIDWTWDLNRHAYFETLGRAYWYTGDERYVQKFQELILDWLAKNPADVDQPNWTSAFEVACRINTWIWAFFYFRSAPTFDRETCLAFLKGLLTHGYYLEANLELHIPNNHLLLEAKALAMLGYLLPEVKRAKKWRQQGSQILCQQVKEQVCSDGGHGERATLYHRIIASQLLELQVLLAKNNTSLPTEIAKALEQMIEFELWMTKPNGLVPLLNDSALEDTYLRFSASSGGPVFLGRSDLKAIAPPPDEASIWLLGHKRIKQYLDLPAEDFCLNSRAFPETGYFVMRGGKGSEAAYLVFDCGPFGYEPVPGHGHADALNLELHAHGQTHLVDPGVYSTYLGEDWRNFFRGSPAHNLVVVDNQDQSALGDIWQVNHPAEATLHQWLSSDEFDFIDGSHNGYERLSEPITHRRQIFFAKPEYWVIIDTLTGQGEHCFDLYFHLMPEVDTQFEPKSGSIHAGNCGEGGLIIVPIVTNRLQTEVITGATDPIQGWVSCLSGEKQPAPVLRYRQTTAAPIQFCTVLYPYTAAETPSIAISRLDIEFDSPTSRSEIDFTGLRLETDRFVDYLLIDRGSGVAFKTFAGFETDAKLLYLRSCQADDRPNTVALKGGNHLFYQGRSII